MRRRCGEILSLLDRERDITKVLTEHVGTLMDKNARLLEALRTIAELTWNPAIGLRKLPYSDLHNVARAALEKALTKHKDGE